MRVKFKDWAVNNVLQLLMLQDLFNDVQWEN